MRSRILTLTAAEAESLGIAGSLSFDEAIYKRMLELARFRERAVVDFDPTYVKVIAYVALTTPDGKVYCYQRGKRMSGSRLVNLYSLGLGGHIEQQDACSLFTYRDKGIMAAAQRELHEEAAVDIDSSQMRPVGFIHHQGYLLGQTHLAVAFIATTAVPVQKGEQAVKGLAARTAAEVRRKYEAFEHWSQILAREWLFANARFPAPRIPLRLFKRLVVVAGRIGSGKSTFSRYLERRYGFRSTMASDVLRRELGRYSEKRDEFQDQCAGWLKENGMRKYASKLIDHCSQYDYVVLDGLRSQEVIPYLREEYQGRLSIVFIDCPPEVAFIRQRSDQDGRLSVVDWDEYARAIEHPDEREGNELRNIADCIIDNTTTGRDALHAEVDRIWRSIIR